MSQVAVPAAPAASRPRSPRRRRLPRLSRLAMAIAAGLLTWVAFPPTGWWFAAPLGVAALTLATDRTGGREAAFLGFCYGLTWFVPLLHWIATLGWAVWLVLAFAVALFCAVLAAGTAVLLRLPGWPLWLACWWVAVEAARSRVPLGGFPWGRLAFAEANGPLVRYAAVAGAPFVSFLVALGGALLAWFLRAAWRHWAASGGPPPPWRAAVAAGVAVGVIAGAWAAVPLPTAGQRAGGPAYATIALIQGNVPRLGLDAFDQRYAVTVNHAAVTERFAALVAQGKAVRPDVVLWPENATDVDPRHDRVVHDLIATAVADVGVPTLVGAITDAPDNRLQNSALVWRPGAEPEQAYIKRHLVPFGEYVPLRSLLDGWVHELQRVPRDMLPGHGSGVVRLGPVRLADVICYEVAYDGLVRSAVRSGGRLIVVQTNNATYGRSETWQQLAMGRLRAVEHGRAVAVVATSGISAIIEPDGRVVAHSGIFTQDVLERRVPLRDSRTLADTVAGWPELGASLAGLLAVLAGLLVMVREPRSPIVRQRQGPVVDRAGTARSRWSRRGRGGHG